MESPLLEAWTETIGGLVIEVEVMMEWAADAEDWSLGSLRWPRGAPSDCDSSSCLSW
jgi:hypothetical protein